MIERGPILRRFTALVCWRLIDLAQWIFEAFRIIIAKQAVSRDLRAMGYRKLSAYPCYMRRPGERLRKKSFPARLDDIAHEKAVHVETIEIWFQDEERISQKNKITSRRARRSTRPSGPRDQRTAST